MSGHDLLAAAPGPTGTRSGPDADQQVSSSSWLDVRTFTIGIVALSLLFSSWYAFSGVGYLLDDWLSIGNVQFRGAWHAAKADQWQARPGAGVVYALVFGVFHGHPLPAFLFQSLIVAAGAAVLWRVFALLLPFRMAVVAALAWVVFPNHTSQEVWLSTANVALAVLLAAVGALLLVRPTPSPPWAVALVFVAAALCYESVIPAVGLAALALPWFARGRVDVRQLAWVWTSQVAVLGWLVTHSHPSRQPGEVADMGQMPAAHLGWGIVPAGPVADAVLLGSMLVLALALGLMILRPERRDVVAMTALVGIVLIVAGAAPFARYFYAPIGAGDRASAVSAIGGALVWAAMVELGVRWRRGVGFGAFALVLLLALVARWDRTQQWTDAAADGVRVLDAVVEQFPEPPDATIIVGPAIPPVDNMVAFLDRSNIEPALRYRYDDPTVQARLATSPEEFVTIEKERRVDVDAVLELGSSCDPISEWLGSCEGRPGR